MYEVQYLDGEKASFAANSIAENLFAQIDGDGNRQVLMDDIIGHRSNEHAVNQQDAFIITKMGTKRRKETTKGWELLIRWKDGGTDWVALNDVKESYPVQVAEYAVLAHISEEPAFTWWASSVLKKRNRIIVKTMSKYWLQTHKFGIEIPKSVIQVRQIDAKCGNTLWWDATCKEMKNVRPAFEVFEGHRSVAWRIPRDKMLYDLRREYWRKFPQKSSVSGRWPHHRDPSHAHLFVGGLT